jgi:hypothetical protein
MIAAMIDQWVMRTTGSHFRVGAVLSLVIAVLAICLLLGVGALQMRAGVGAGHWRRA